MFKLSNTIYVLIFILSLSFVNIAFSRDFSPKRIYRENAKAVVFIFASNSGNNGMAGTGSILSSDGLVITNAHVIYDDERGALFKKIFIFLKPEKVVGDMDRDLTRRYETEVLYYQNDLDLALIKIKGFKGNLPKIEFANPDEISVGEDVVAIGHPEQGGLWTLTTGTISTVKANFEGVPGKDVFQTEASVNKGNSGGPLLDKRGYMVGVNSNIARKNAQGLAITDINFSIKSSVAKSWLKEKGYIMAYGTKPLEEEAPPSLVINKEKESKPVVESEPLVVEKPKVIEKPKELLTQEPEVKEEIKEVKVEVVKEPKIITEKRPYNMEKFIQKWSVKIEREMEDLMGEMRGKTRTLKEKKTGDLFDEF